MRNKNELTMTPSFWVGNSMDGDILYQDKKYKSKDRLGEKVNSTSDLVFLRH